MYDSSLMARHGQPYFVRTGDSNSFAHGYRFGTDSTLVEVPVSWHLDDAPRLEPVFSDVGMANFGLQNPNEVREIYLDEIRFAATKADVEFVNFTFHRAIIGRGARILLDALLAEVAQNPNLEFGTCAQIA